MLRRDNLFLYVALSAFITLTSVPFWADGFDRDLLEESISEYQEETGDTVYRADDSAYFIAVSQKGTVRHIELHNVFDAEITDIIELEEVK